MAWDPSKHPRHPAGAPQSKGGEFAPLERAALDRLMRLTEPDSGFTYQPFSKDEPREGFAVSIYPDRSWAGSVSDMSPATFVSFIMDNMDLLTQPGNYIGGWHDPVSHKVFLDVSRVVKSAAEAERLARENDQIAYFDLKGGRSVDVDRSAKSGGVV